MYRSILVHTDLRPCIFRIASISTNKTTLGLRSKHDIVKQVLELPDWDLEAFRDRAFNAKHPAKLRYTPSVLPKACTKWFIHDGDANHKLNTQPNSSELKPEFWSEYGSVPVPLELTSTNTSSDTYLDSTFHRSEARLEVLLAYLNIPRTTVTTSTADQSTRTQQQYAMYLAQCDLNSLPTSLSNDIPTPTLVKSSGKGDVYSSSLWLGRPPTYTPLHRDPNPNLFWQLAGHKVVRLLPPEIGNAVFEDVQAALSSSGLIKSTNSASFRGEEMMHGPEKEMLHSLVWAGASDSAHVSWVASYAVEAKLGLGEALFIPKGWWHSVKGVGTGVTASANWWFR